MKKDLISVIVPCYNVSKFLEDCFLSLQNQTYKNVELIFVNDGSKDDTLEKLQNFCKDKPNCKLVNQQNKGLSGARNSGIEIAEGEFIYFCDPDDLLSPNLLEILHKNITSFNVDCSMCKYLCVKENFQFRQIKQSKQKEKIKIYKSTSECLNQMLAYKTFPHSVWDKLYKHSILKSYTSYPNIFNENIKYSEDTDFNYFYMSKINSCSYSNLKLYYYRQRKHSIIHSKFNEKRFTILIGLNDKIQYFSSNFPEFEKYVRCQLYLSSRRLLYGILKSNYYNKKQTDLLLETMKENKKYFKQAKKLHLYLRIFMPCSYTVLKILFLLRIQRGGEKNETQK